MDAEVKHPNKAYKITQLEGIDLQCQIIKRENR